MRGTLGLKLIAIVGVAALAFVVLIIASSVLATRVDTRLAVIEEQHLPQLELGPNLQNGFERIHRSFQDAVAAQDRDALAAVQGLKSEFLRELDAARGVVDDQVAAALRAGFEDYFAAAHDVSSRLIAGESGEALVDKMAVMQAKHVATADLLAKLTHVDHQELSGAFAEARRAQATAAQVRLFVSLLCLAMVLLLSLWISRGVLRSVGQLSSGLERFGRGEFSQAIEVTARDEIGALAGVANQMAQSLDRLGRERDHADWIRSAQVGLTSELRGDLDPEELAARALRLLARYLEAPVAAFYGAEQDGALRLLAHHGVSTAGATASAAFQAGEGLVGQAALQDEVVVVSDVPADHLTVRSGLGESLPRTLVLLPLRNAGKVSGVLEFALFKQWSERRSELLASVRETLAIGLEVARARAVTRELLAETQRQAQRLGVQEEELRAANEELQAQQQELRRANEELTQQAEELEAQKRELEQTNVELGSARERLERKADELASVSTYKSQFLANMSHELRTPLNSMLLLSDLLGRNEAGNMTDKQVEFCKTINGAGKDLLALINQVLDLAKVESGKQNVSIEPVPLREVVDHMQRMFTPLARDKGLEFRVEVLPAVPETIWTDRQRIEQILNNLIGNAVKFTENGAVTLRVAPPEPGARLTRSDVALQHMLTFSVLDTGIGIAAEHHAAVFAPFEQVEARPNRRYGGTGLGLTIARELSALLGGELQLRSAAGQGSAFVCYLPFERPKGALAAEQPLVVRAQDAVMALAGAGARSANGPGSGSGHASTRDAVHILVIEDDLVFAETVGDVIREQGLKCMIAQTGEAGMRLAKEHAPRGIILDVKLPGVDGFEVMQLLRDDPATASIPVHFVSALEAGERGMALGAIGYLTKPASHRDLVRVVQSLAPKVSDRVCRVLIVEDDVDIADSLVEQLGGRDFSVRRASKASEALALLAHERFDCMVLDLGLPDMDGLEFLGSLKEQSAELPPIVVYTGRALSKAEAQRLEAYTEAVVLKDGPGADRLLDEVRLFARRLREGLPPSRKLASRALPAQVHIEGKKVLLADDDMRTVYALSALLRAKGAEVLVADTGRAALEMLHAHPEVDIVLMDIMMPEMDGYEAMRRIREEERFAQLPIMALTAKAMKGDREKCLEAGATDYMSKPIDPDGLLAILHARLSEAGNGG